jgi:hypothetical protein
MGLLNRLRAVAVLTWAWTVAVAITLVAASPAAAQKTEMYAGFSHCPTSAPEMNNPENIGAACISAVIHGGSIRLGNVGATVSSPLHMQAAFVGGEVGPVIVPGSTTLEGEPVTLPNPFVTQPPPPGEPGGGSTTPPPSTDNGTPPPAAGTGTPPPPPPVKKPQKKKKKHHKKQHKKKHHKRHRKPVHRKGKGKNAGRRKKGWSSFDSLLSMAPRGKAPRLGATATPTTARASDANASELIEVVVEPAGDIRNLNLGAFVEEPGVAFELPVKMHLTGTGLGSQCYIGSDAEPIVIAPEQSAPFASLGFGLDPNGFLVKVISVGGESFEDSTLTIPGASGCGEVAGGLDAQIDSLIGLPAASGKSQFVFENVLLELVGTEYIEGAEGPQGGAELQAAFEAAQQ